MYIISPKYAENFAAMLRIENFVKCHKSQYYIRQNDPYNFA